MAVGALNDARPRRGARTPGRPMPSADVSDPVVAQMLSALLLDSHLMAPGTLATHLTEAARPLGVAAVRIYLADLPQHLVRPMPDRSGERAASQAIESTTAGRAFQTTTILYSRIEHPA